MEKFEIIKEFLGYSISRSGIVINNKTMRTLIPDANRSGYLMIRFCVGGKAVARYVARLVATTYILNPENKPEVNHIDGNKHNNWDWNLEWCTKSENRQHGIRTGLIIISEDAGRPKKPIMVTGYKSDKVLSIHPSLDDAATAYGVQPANVSKVIRGLRNHTGGFTFKLF